MKNLVLVLLFTISGILCFAQNDTKQITERPLNNISLGLFSDGTVLSVNYERFFVLKKDFFIAGKIGIGFSEEFRLCVFGPCSTPAETAMSMTYFITGNHGKEQSFFEFGLGGIMIGGTRIKGNLFFPIIGYRFLPLKSNKVSFRIFAEFPFVRLFNTDSLNIWFLPVGINVGISI